LETPITGGNVSFYNETLGKPIYPTPILGVLGLIEDADCAMGSAFRHEGDVIVLLDSGRAANSIDAGRREFSSSEYAKTIHGIVAGAPPMIDLGMEKNLVECLVELAAEKTIISAHDVSDGGLAVTVAECCFESNGLSADVSFVDRGFSRDPGDVQMPGAPAPEELPAEVALFGERGGRAVVSVSPASLARLNAVAAKWNVRGGRIGAVTRSDFRIQYNETTVIRGGADWFRQAWSESLRKAIEGE